MAIPLTLGQKRQLFTRLLAELVVWAFAQGYALSLSEGYVRDSIDKPAEDSPHRRDGGHFKGLAQDLNLFVAGEWAHDESRPEWRAAWRALGEHWEHQHSLCRWGGRWGDPNHFSLEDGGVA
jgi:hypothetical protein